MCFVVTVDFTDLPWLAPHSFGLRLELLACASSFWLVPRSLACASFIGLRLVHWFAPRSLVCASFCWFTPHIPESGPITMSVSHSPGSGAAFLSRVSFSSFYLVYFTMPGSFSWVSEKKAIKGGGETVEGKELGVCSYYNLYPIPRDWNWVNNKVGSERASANPDFYRSRNIDALDRD